MPRTRRKTPQKRTIRRSHKSKTPKVANLKPRLFHGLFFVVAGILLISIPLFASRLSPQPNQSDSFSSEPVKIDPALTKQQSKSSPIRVIIPSVGVDLPVKLSPVQNGYWVVYPDAAGFGEGSALPGEGNTVIFAHAREGLFLPLREVKPGARVYVFSQDRHFTYEITETKEVLPNQIEVIAPTADPALTLYTCSGFFDKKRLIVVAKPV